MKNSKHLFTIFLFVLVHSLSFCQMKPGELWHAKYVQDTKGGIQSSLPIAADFGEKDKTIQSFMSMEEDSLVHIIFFKQFFKMETGEIKIVGIWDTLSIGYADPFNLLLNKKDEVEFMIRQQSDSMIILGDEQYRFEYRKLKESQSHFKADSLLSIIVNNDFAEIRNNYGVPEERKLHFLNKKHVLHWKEEKDKENLYYQNSPLFTDYKLFEFNGHLIWKGITSNPKIVQEIQGDQVVIVEYDNIKSERVVVFWKKLE